MRRKEGTFYEMGSGGHGLGYNVALRGGGGAVIVSWGVSKKTERENSAPRKREKEVKSGMEKEGKGVWGEGGGLLGGGKGARVNGGVRSVTKGGGHFGPMAVSALWSSAEHVQEGPILEVRFCT